MRSTLPIVTALAIAGLVRTDVRAHHTAVHDQNPSPPAKVVAVDTFTFGAGSIIIPLDSCYQRPTFVNDSELAQILQVVYEDPTATATSKLCNTTAQDDDGLIPAYSLVQRLVRDGIRVHWALKGSKTSFNDWDLKIAKAGGGPVVHSTRLGVTSNRYASLVEIRYAGAPFIIEAGDAAAAMTKLATYTQSNGGASYDMVDLHVAQVPFSAPVYSSLAELPKLAVLDLSDPSFGLINQQSTKLFGSIAEAIMSDMELPAAGGWWDRVTLAEVAADRLTAEDFTLAWVPAFELPLFPTSAQITLITKLAGFANAGGHLLFQDAAIASLEGFGTFSGSYTPTRFSISSYQADGGLVLNGVPSTWDNGNDSEHTVGDDFSDPAAQFGGMFWTGIGGSKFTWKVRFDRAYHEGVRRMIFTQHATDDTKSRWDIATWRYKDNDPAKGVIYYLGGDNWRRVTAAGLRVLLNTVFVHTTSSPAVREVSRASPIFASINGTDTIVQGTFEQSFPSLLATQLTSAADAPLFRFPAQQGHMRAIPTTAIDAAGTTGDTFVNLDSSALLDAADAIPTPAFATGCPQPYNGTCRAVFTHLETGNGGGDGLTPVGLDVTAVSTLGPVMAPGLTVTEWTILIERVLAGRETAPDSGVFEPALGGVDRSTVAVIPPSTLATTRSAAPPPPAPQEQPASTRPTMVYFGATDGMLHAVCATTGGGCDVVGRELWAFVPRTLLPELRTNTARIDGSPHVADLFGDFDGDGLREMRTILLFQTGWGDPLVADRLPAVHAIDVTDPAQPRLMWEYTRAQDPTVTGALPEPTDDFDHGRGLTIVAGRVRVGAADQLLAFAQANNGGAQALAAAASVTTAIDIPTGAFVWQHEYAYPAPRNTANPLVPVTGLPGGVTAVDKTGNGRITDLVFGTLYGDLFLVDPATGQNRHGANPLLSFGTDFHPIGVLPALFTLSGAPGAEQFAAFGTGGFADQTGGSWSASANQFAVAVSLDTPTGDTPIVPSEPGPGVKDTSQPNLSSIFGLGTNQVFSQALVVGDDVFFVADSTNVNATGFGTSGAATGTAYKLEHGSTTTLTAVITGGSSSLINRGGTLYAGSGDKAQQVTVGSEGAGFAVKPLKQPKLSRKLWVMTL